MAYLPRHQVHKKKKSRFPWILIVLAGFLIGGIYSQEKKIRLFLSGDLRQKIEKQKDRIQSAIKTNELSEVLTRDFHTYTTDFLEKHPLDPSAHFFKSQAHYYELLLSGARFDSFSLTTKIQEPILFLFGDNEQVENSFAKMYEFSRRAVVMDESFEQSASNRFLLFMGETYRAKKKPDLLYEDYKGISIHELDEEFSHPYVWLLFYSVVRTGNAKDLDSLLEKNRMDDFPGKLLLTEREIHYLKGICYYYAKDYVLSLQSMRKVKSPTAEDKIHTNAVLIEAKIFYLQNLPQKGIDLLLNSYNRSKNKEKKYLSQLKEWAGKRPDLKISIPEESKAIEPSEKNEDDI